MLSTYILQDLLSNIAIANAIQHLLYPQYLSHMHYYYYRAILTVSTPRSFSYSDCMLDTDAFATL